MHAKWKRYAILFQYVHNRKAPFEFSQLVFKILIIKSILINGSSNYLSFEHIYLIEYDYNEFNIKAILQTLYKFEI